MPDLKLFLLGSPRVEHAGAQITMDTRKAIALLAYLAITRTRHSRDALAVLLWPEYDQASARGALRRTLSTLKKALGGVGLDAERETIRLDSAAVWLDVEQFQRLLATGHANQGRAAEECADDSAPLIEAAALYADHFMAGFSLRDSPNFDDWQFFQAESLRRDLAAVLERLTDCQARVGALDPAIGYARRWLALDPLHEPAHQQLMRLYAWAGQRAAALHQYRECVRVLDQELGVPPLEETTQLYHAIKENLPPPAPAPIANKRPALSAPAAFSGDLDEGVQAGQIVPASPPHPISDRPAPLVGREAEWSATLGAYTAIGSDGHLIVLEGEPGIGKTRLAEELLAHARSNGAVTISARCYEGETTLAYGPFLEGLRAALRQPGSGSWMRRISARWLSEAARLLPELAHPDLPPLSPLDTPGAQSRFFEGIVQVLLAACGGAKPGILLLDDLHWADAGSINLLAYLVRRLRGQPVCLLVTWRAESMPAGHAARAILAEAQRDGLATSVSLGRLSQAAVIELARCSTMVGAPDLEQLGERLYSATEGLPFFVVEYLAALAQQDRSGDAWAAPSGVRNLLRARLAGLSETGRQVLTTAAVIGRSFDYDSVREASGRGEDEAVEALEQLIGHGLIREVHNRTGDDARLPTYDFYHEQLRALVYQETSLARRRLLHRRVAEALIGRSRGQADRGGRAGIIAHHYHLAGQDAAAAEYFAIAGEHARSLYANIDALAHFEAALALGHPNVSAIHQAIGDLHTLLGEYGAALRSYETAAALCPPDTLAPIERRLADIHRRRGEWDLAESHLQAALDALGEHGRAGEQARLYADWSLTAHRRGQPGRAKELAQRALDLAQAADDARALAEAHNILGILASRGGDLDGARQYLERSLALAEALHDDSARAAALNNLALAYGSAGAGERALALATTAAGIYAAQGDRHREAALHNNIADLLYAAGRSEDAMTHLKRAVTIFAEIGADAGEMQPEIWKLVEW